MKKDLTELVFILDRSGSMSGLEGDTIGGFNAMLQKQQAIEGECRVTTVLFDHSYKLLHDRIDIRTLNPLTEKEYYVGGSTALIDAIGRTINKIVNVQKNTAEEYRAEKVRTMIEQEKEKYGWEFVFLGANIDAVQTAGQFGISPDRAADYVPDAVGTALNFAVMAEAVAEYREENCISGRHFDRIRKDMKKRGRHR